MDESRFFFTRSAHACHAQRRPARRCERGLQLRDRLRLASGVAPPSADFKSRVAAPRFSPTRRPSRAGAPPAAAGGRAALMAPPAPVLFAAPGSHLCSQRARRVGAIAAMRRWSRVSRRRELAHAPKSRLGPQSARPAGAGRVARAAAYARRWRKSETPPPDATTSTPRAARATSIRRADPRARGQEAFDVAIATPLYRCDKAFDAVRKAALNADSHRLASFDIEDFVERSDSAAPSPARSCRPARRRACNWRGSGRSRALKKATTPSTR